MDLSKHGNCYACVPDWLEVYAVSDCKVTTVAHFPADFIWRHEIPAQIIHDRAVEFLSDILQETAEVLGVTQLITSTDGWNSGETELDTQVDALWYPKEAKTGMIN